jgi:hypothetical protein
VPLGGVLGERERSLSGGCWARCAVRRTLVRRQTVMSWSCWTLADPRFLAMASSKGHIATFDWQAGKLNAEIQLREPVRDIKYVLSALPLLTCEPHPTPPVKLNGDFPICRMSLTPDSFNLNHSLLLLRRNMSSSTTKMVLNYSKSAFLICVARATDPVVS